MALYNLARVTTATTGTGTITLGAAVAGFLTFASAGVPDGAVVTYAIKDGSNSEIGRGTYTLSGLTLTRTVLKSTNSNTAISLSGSAEVVITAAAEDFSEARGYEAPLNLSLSVSAASSALTIAIKGADGNDPSLSNVVQFPFRSATATTGTVTWRTLTAASSIVISSGSTLGVTSSTAFRLWVVMFDDAGTLRPGVMLCSTYSSLADVKIYPLLVGGIASSTAEGGAGAADSAQVFYTGTAVTSKPYAILGYVEWTASGLTAGTWTTSNLGTVQVYGPGVRLPGSQVQLVQTQTSTGFTTTSSTYQTTTVSASISPTSAANLVKCEASGPCEVDAAAQLAFIALFRGTTRLTGASGFYVASSAVNIAPYAQTVLDAPNSTSSQTYAAKLRNLNNSSTVSFPTAGTGETPYATMVLTEIAA